MRKMKDSGVEWLKTIPESWHVAPLKSMFNFGKGLPITKENLIESGIPVISYGQIHAKWNSGVTIHEELKRFVSEEYIVANPNSLVKNGDFIMADTSEDREGCGNCAYVDTDEQIFAGYHTIILNSTDASSHKYLAYLFLTDPWRSQIRKRVSGVKLFSVSRRILGDVSVILPSEKEALKIVAILDEKCAKIDTLITNQQRQIEKLKQYKQSLITEVVTKGLDSNALMKDSGVEWLGSVPNKWDVCRIGDLYSERNERGNDTLPILTVSINSGISDKEIPAADSERIFIRSEDRSVYKRVYPGDLAYNMMRAWQGAFGAVRVDGMISPAYIVAKPKRRLDSRYFEALLRTPSATEEMHRFSRGIVDFRLRLYWPEFKNIRVCLPSLEEQSLIADYLDTQNGRIDKLIEIKQSKIEKLYQYKKSVIYEYVTGKKEVN